MAGQSITISLLGDASALNRGLNSATDNLQDTARTAQQAGSRIEGAMDGVAESADGVASRGSQAAGALGGLGDLAATSLGFPALGNSMMVAGTAFQGFADAGDLVNVVMESNIVRTTKARVATIANTVATKAAAAASKVWAVAQGALNAVMALNPIMLTVIAITALVAAVVIAYQKSETFRAIVDRLWRVMKDVGAWFAGVFVSLFNKGAAAFDYVRGKAAAAFGWVKTNWPLLLAIITGPIGLAVYAVTKNFDRIKDAAGGAKNWVVTKFNELVGFVTGLPGRISTATSGMWNGIKNAFRSAVNAVIGWWNDLEFTIPAIKVAGVQISPAITIGTPYIPALARGGITTGPTLAMVGDNPGGREAIIPLDRYDALGTTNVYVTVNVPVGGSPVDTGRAIANALQAFYGAGGRVVVP